jgi:hypothetical protein
MLKKKSLGLNAIRLPFLCLSDSGRGLSRRLRREPVARAEVNRYRALLGDIKALEPGIEQALEQLAACPNRNNRPPRGVLNGMHDLALAIRLLRKSPAFTLRGTSSRSRSILFPNESWTRPSSRSIDSSGRSNESNRKSSACARNWKPRYEPASARRRRIRAAHQTLNHILKISYKGLLLFRSA